MYRVVRATSSVTYIQQQRFHVRLLYTVHAGEILIALYQPEPIICTVKINDVPLNLLVDTGAVISMILLTIFH